MKLFALLPFLLFLFSSCHPNGEHVTREMYGNAWPFTVDEGYIECREYAILFHTDGKTYVLQGEPFTMREAMKGEPVYNLDEIWSRQDSAGMGWAANMPLDTLISRCPPVAAPHHSED